MFTSASIGSFFATSISMPMDVVKSRIQNMPAAQPGKPALYKNMVCSVFFFGVFSWKYICCSESKVDCAKISVRNEGFLVLWSGFLPAYIKMAPYTVISLTLLEVHCFILFSSRFMHYPCFSQQLTQWYSGKSAM